MRHAPALATLGLLSALGVCAAGLLAFRLRPLELHSAWQRLMLRAAGVQAVHAGDLSGFERNRCVAAEPCRCVALVHGLGDSALTWHRLLRGDGAPHPPAGYRLLALDLAGTEGSPAPAAPEGYSVPSQARAVRNALEGRCERWTVAGNSLGGWISLWLALEWPQGVERLVLLNSAGVDDPTGTVARTARVLSAPTTASLKEFRQMAWHAAPPVPELAWEAAARLIASRGTAKTVAAFKPEHLLDDRLENLTMPVAVLWGASDRAVPIAVGRRLNRLIRGSTLELLPDCGHLPQQECPAAVARALY